MSKQSVSKKALNKEADSIEASAKESLDSWIVLGQAHKYEAAMERVRILRHLAAMSIAFSRSDKLAFLNAPIALAKVPA